MKIETIEHKGFEVEVFYDEYLESPREWYNLGTMACSHSRYNLGDEKLEDLGGSAEEVDETLKEMDAVVVLPLYVYEHGGITMNTSGFSCPWDSGQVGIIYITRDTVKKELGWKRITAARMEKLREYLTGEVETFDQYLRGEVYGYSWEGGGCGGFYDMNEMKREAIDEIDNHVEAQRSEAIKNHTKRLKLWIKNNVPMSHREPCPEVV